MKDVKSNINKIISIVIEVITFLLIIYSIIKLIKSYGTIPYQVPNHYTADGKIKDYMSKSMLIVFTTFDIVIYLIFSLAELWPQYANFPVEINKYNKDKMYSLGTNLSRYVKLEITLVLDITIISILDRALKKTFILDKIGVFGLSIIGLIIAVFLTLIVYVRKMISADKNIKNNLFD